MFDKKPLTLDDLEVGTMLAHVHTCREFIITKRVDVAAVDLDPVDGNMNTLHSIGFYYMSTRFVRADQVSEEDKFHLALSGNSCIVSDEWVADRKDEYIKKHGSTM